MKKFSKLIFGLLLSGAIFVSNPKSSRAEKIIINHNVSPGVNVRSEKSDTSPILGGIDYQDYYEVIDEDDNWYEILYDGKTSYVGKQWFFKLYDYKLIKDTPLKKAQARKSKTIETLKKDKDSVTILEIYSDDMAKVISKDKIGYIDIKNLDLYRKKYKTQNVHKDRIKYINKVLKKHEDFGKIQDYEFKDGNFTKDRSEDEKIQYVDEKIIYEYFDVTGNGADLYWYASQFLGNPYVFGRNDLVSGVDCSGFTKEVYKEFGITLPRIAQDQYFIGTDVKLGDELAGDLVFYGKSTENITHVAIADGNGGIIHASSPKTGIITSYIGNPIAIKRIIE